MMKFIAGVLILYLIFITVFRKWGKLSAYKLQAGFVIFYVSLVIIAYLLKQI